MTTSKKAEFTMMTEYDLAFLRSEITNNITGKRLAHSFAVEAEAAVLAELFGMSTEETNRLRACAILHDITKGKKTDEQTVLCRELGIEVSDELTASPKVFHSLTGALLARKLYPELVDEEMKDVIYCHTTGKEAMTLPEKLLYLADYIEPTRDFPDCVRLREYFYSAPPTERHLDETLLLSFDMTLDILRNESQPIHSTTLAARNHLAKKLNQNEKQE